MNPRRTRTSQQGFTLIELMTVIAIIGILAAIALPNYKAAILLSKEAVLREDLHRLRSILDQYHADKGKYPESLEALVTEGYLRQIPLDPMTKAANWEVEMEQANSDDPGAVPGIEDIHSAYGPPYSEW